MKSHFQFKHTDKIGMVVPDAGVEMDGQRLKKTVQFCWNFNHKFVQTESNYCAFLNFIHYYMHTVSSHTTKPLKGLIKPTGLRKYRKPLTHSVVCLRAGPQLLPKWVLHSVHSSVSSFKFQDLLISLRSSSNCLYLPLLPIFHLNYML